MIFMIKNRKKEKMKNGIICSFWNLGVTLHFKTYVEMDDVEMDDKTVVNDI